MQKRYHSGGGPRFRGDDKSIAVIGFKCNLRKIKVEGNYG